MAKSTNLNAVWGDVTVGTSETTVAHALGRVPKEAFIWRSNGAGRVYRGSTEWDSANIYVQASASVLVRLVIM